MGGWSSSWPWWAAGAAGAATTGYLVLANAVDILMRRWARRAGCPVCGAVRVGQDEEHRSATPQAGAGSGGR